MRRNPLYSRYINLLLSAEDSNELTIILDSHKFSYILDSNFENVGDDFSGFDIDSIQNLMVAIGGTGTIAALAKVLTTYLKERKKEIMVKRKNGSLEITTKNVNVQEVKELLDSLREKETIFIVSGDHL